jgi:hypothetical protein
VQSKNGTYIAATSSGAASSASSQFTMVPMAAGATGRRRLSQSARSIALGDTVLLRSAGTRQYCRVAALAPAAVADPNAAPFPQK